MTLQLFAVQGPMARRVRDLRVALAAMSDRDGRDPWWTPAPLAGEPEASLPVAVVPRPPGGDVHPDVEAAVRRAARALADAGYRVEEAEPPGVLEAAELWSSLVFAEIRSALLPVLRPVLSREALRFLDLALESAPESDLPGYAAGLAARQGIARRWSVFQERTPLVLGPVCTEPPFRVGRDLESAESVGEILLSMRLVVAVNLLGLPAAAVPVGQAGGLPQGVQIIGPRYREDLCLDAAEAIESRLGTLTPIDP